MRDILTDLQPRWAAGESMALATVVATFQSAPRAPGAAMLVAGDGTVAGSVSGGCVEGAVYELAQQVLESDLPVLQRYGVSDDDAFTVGLTCGGILDVFVEKLSPTTFPELGEVLDAIAAERAIAVATVVAHPDADLVGRRILIAPEPVTDSGGDAPRSGLWSTRAEDAVREDALGLLAAGRSDTLEYGADGERRGEGMRVFVNSFAPKPRMFVFGAIDFAAAIARVGSFLGYRVTVCDARPVFATHSRFPEADEVIVEWPHRYLARQVAEHAVGPRDVICVLTHDPKFDVPVLEVALRQDVAYVGAMGSRRTHEDRWRRLLDAGLTEAELAHLSSPIGLDLGARTPEETAISIAAEIIAVQWGGAGDRLRATRGAIHRSGSAAAPG